MPTTNPVPSQDPSDLLFNAGKLDEVLNGASTSFTDRLGTARRTVAGMNADFDAQLADAESDLNVYRADAAASAAQALGYLNTIRTTSYGAYASDPATDPLGNPPNVGDEYFNTTSNLLKRFNGTTWQASDINTANLAAPSGSSLVGYDGGTVQDVLDGAKSLQDYAALRAYTGRAKRIYITGLQVTAKPAGIAGVFQHDTTDTTSADNGGTIIVGADGRRFKRDYSGAVSVAWFGADSMGSVDSTNAIKAAHAASKCVDYPDGRYLVSWTEGTSLVSYTSKAGIRIRGQGATLIDSRNYAVENISAVFSLVSCSNVKIDLNYEGVQIVDKSHPSTGVGYRGATFVNMSTGCNDVEVNGDLKYLRYGVRGGDYTIPAKGENNKIKCNLTTLECGYPVTLYLSADVDLDLHSEGSHRTAYLAGVRNGTVNARFKNQYIAPIQVLLTDATTNGLSYPDGVSRGCSNLRVKAHDLGSTTYLDNSFCAAISMSRGDQNTLFEDIEIDVYVKSSDTVASKLSAFALYNNFLPYQPSYPNDWEQSFVFRNIKITGTLDRSEQTVAENSSSGEIYIYAFNSGSNYGTLSGVDISGFRYYPGSGAKTRGFYFVAPGLVGTSKIENCDFGTTTPFTLITNGNSLVSFNATRLRGSYTGTSDSPYNSAASFTDCVINDPAYQPLTNKTFYNTTIKGSRTAIVTKIVDAALSGSTVTLTSAIPSGCVVVGVSGIVTTAITGATGFEVGVSGDLTRYGNMFATAQDTKIAAVTNSVATAPINYPSFTNLLVTAKTAAFTGGAIRLAIHYISFTNLTL